MAVLFRDVEDGGCLGICRRVAAQQAADLQVGAPAVPRICQGIGGLMDSVVEKFELGGAAGVGVFVIVGEGQDQPPGQFYRPVAIEWRMRCLWKRLGWNWPRYRAMRNPEWKNFSWVFKDRK